MNTRIVFKLHVTVSVVYLCILHLFYHSNYIIILSSSIYYLYIYYLFIHAFIHNTEYEHMVDEPPSPSSRTTLWLQAFPFPCLPFFARPPTFRYMYTVVGPHVARPTLVPANTRRGDDSSFCSSGGNSRKEKIRLPSCNSSRNLCWISFIIDLLKHKAET